MATSDAPLNVPNVTLAVARGASSGGSWTSGQPPAISSVSGALAYGNTMSISGSNISSEVGVQTFYDDFTGGAVGENLVGWETEGGSTPYPYKHSDVGAYSDSGRLALSKPRGTGNFRNIARQNSFNATELFVMFRMRVTSVDPLNPGKYKFQTILGGDDHTSHVLYGPRFGMFYNENYTFFAYSLEDNVTGDPFSTPALRNKDWILVQQYVKADSVPGAGDGRRFARTSLDLIADNSSGTTFNSNGGSTPAYAWDSDPVETISATSAYQTFDQFWLPWYGEDVDWEVSNVWISKSRESVILSPAATWTDTISNLANFSKIMPQKMTARTATGIDFEPDLGLELQTGPVYAYVVNHDGLANETGFQVRAA